MRKFFVAAAVAAAALICSASSADAAFAVRITTLSGTQTITDNGVGDASGLSNLISVTYTDGSYLVVGTIAFTNSPGNPNFAIIDASFNIVTANGATGGLATLETSATAFSQPAGSPLYLTSQFNGNGFGTGTISSQSYITSTQTLFATAPGATSGLQGPFNIAAAGGFNSTGTATYTGGNPFTLTNVLTFNLGQNAQTSGDSHLLVSTPAPAGLVLALTAVPVLGIGGWMRRRRMSV